MAAVTLLAQLQQVADIQRAVLIHKLKLRNIEGDNLSVCPPCEERVKSKRYESLKKRDFDEVDGRTVSVEGPAVSGAQGVGPGYLAELQGGERSCGLPQRGRT